MGSDDKKLKFQKDGMPDMSDETIEEESTIKALLGSVFNPLPLSFIAIPVTIGVAVALAIHQFVEKEEADKRIEALGSNAGCLFLAAILFSRMTLKLNFGPMDYKKKIMLGKSGNLRTNMAIYKPLKPDGETDAAAPAVVMVADGDVGKYNRANRSLAHFTENVPSTLFMLFCVGPIFPAATLGIVAVYAYGRVSHQNGEAEKYGAHGLGFLFSVLANSVLEGLCWVAAAQSFGISVPLLGLGSADGREL